MTLVNVLSFCDILNVENKFLFNIFLVNYYVNAYFESIIGNIVFPDAHTLKHKMVFHVPELKTAASVHNLVIGQPLLLSIGNKLHFTRLFFFLFKIVVALINFMSIFL